MEPQGAQESSLLGNCCANRICLQEHDQTKRHGILLPVLKDFIAGNGRLWGNDHRPKGDVRKRSFSNEARSAKTRGDDAPTVIDVCGLCLGDNLSTEA